MRRLLAPTSLLAASVLLAAALPAQRPGRASKDSVRRARAAAIWSPPRPAFAVAVDTNDAEVYLFQGYIRLRTEPLVAAQMLAWATRLDPANARALLLRAQALRFARPKEFGPGDWLRVDSLALAAFFLDPFVMARPNAMTPFLPGVERARAALTRHSDAVMARVHLATAFYAAGQFDSTVAQIAAALDAMRRTEAKHAGPYGSKEMFEYAAATAYLAAGDTASARLALERALAEDLSFYPAHDALGAIAWASQRDTATAVREFEFALQLRPTDAAMRTNYGLVLLQAGRYDEAASQFLRAVELEPYFINPRFNVALTYHLMGRREDALARYREFLDRAPRRFGRQIDAARQNVALLSATAAPAAPAPPR